MNGRSQDHGQYIQDKAVYGLVYRTWLGFQTRKPHCVPIYGFFPGGWRALFESPDQFLFAKVCNDWGTRDGTAMTEHSQTGATISRWRYVTMASRINKRFIKNNCRTTHFLKIHILKSQPPACLPYSILSRTPPTIAIYFLDDNSTSSYWAVYEKPG